MVNGSCVTQTNQIPHFTEKLKLKDINLLKKITDHGAEVAWMSILIFLKCIFSVEDKSLEWAREAELFSIQPQEAQQQ